MMMEQEFNRLVNQIVALGYDAPTAARYAALIGDTPCIDERGRIVVRDEQGRDLARLSASVLE